MADRPEHRVLGRRDLAAHPPHLADDPPCARQAGVIVQLLQRGNRPSRVLEELRDARLALDREPQLRVLEQNTRLERPVLLGGCRVAGSTERLLGSREVSALEKAPAEVEQRARAGGELSASLVQQPQLETVPYGLLEVIADELVMLRALLRQPAGAGL